MYLELQHVEYGEYMDQHRDEYQKKCDEAAANYDEASQAAKDAFKKEITELFDRFKEAFEESNNNYIKQMNKLTASLHTKIATVKQHSMVQRSMIMNLYQDFCDGLFYFSFAECYQDNYVPTMSDDFGVLLEKLVNIQWDSIIAMEDLPNLPETFTNVRIIYDKKFNSLHVLCFSMTFTWWMNICLTLIHLDCLVLALFSEKQEKFMST